MDEGRRRASVRYDTLYYSVQRVKKVGIIAPSGEGQKKTTTSVKSTRKSEPCDGRRERANLVMTGANAKNCWIDVPHWRCTVNMQINHWHRRSLAL